MIEEQSQQSAQEQLDSILGPLLGKHVLAEGESRASSPPKKPRRDDAEGKAHLSHKQLQELVLALARLTLRQEDSLRTLQLDTGFMIFAQTAATEQTLSIVPLLFKASSTWKASREQGRVSVPLRTVLMQALLKALHQRVRQLTTLDKDGPEVKKLTETNILNGKYEFPYMYWEAEKKKLELDTSRSPLPVSDVLKMLKEIETALEDPGTISKFHGTRPLTASPSTQVLPFMLHISLRGEQSARTHALLTRMCGNSCLSLVAIRMWPETLKRSQLAEQVAKMLPRKADPST